MLGKKKKEDDIIEIEGEYLRALKKKYVPILTLDGRWHQLFPDSLKTKKLKKLEKDLNRLIKKQGKTNTDIKEYEKAKKILMKNVLNNNCIWQRFHKTNKHMCTAGYNTG